MSTPPVWRARIFPKECRPDKIGEETFWLVMERLTHFCGVLDGHGPQPGVYMNHNLFLLRESLRDSVRKLLKSGFFWTRSLTRVSWLGFLVAI